MKSDFLTPDFLLESAAARELYHGFAEGAPIVDFHNHLDVKDFCEDRKFQDIGSFWVCSDGYKYRAMRIAGFDEKYMTGGATVREKFDAWCSLLPKTIGNPLFHWSCMEMRGIFGIGEIPDAHNSAEIWECCNGKLLSDEYSVNSILRRMGVVRATTSNDLLEDVSLHPLATEKSGIEMTPSLRGDSILAFDKPGFADWAARLCGGVAAASLEDYLDAVRTRLELFSASACRLSDHALDNGFMYMETDMAKASTIYAEVIGGTSVTTEEYVRLKSFVLRWLSCEYARRRWVMQLHIGAERWTSTRLRAAAGPAGGYACPGSTCDIRSLCDFLDSLDCEGLLPKTVVYTLNPADNAVLATLTGSYALSAESKLKFGPAWWYNDHIYGILENLEACASYSLLPYSLGMTTDSRNVLSFSRHEYFRRILCNFLGDKVSRGQLPSDIDFLGGIVRDISYRNANNWIYE